jgi:hypothetical protein
MPDLSAGAGREQTVRIAWRREEQLEISQRPRWAIGSNPLRSCSAGQRSASIACSMAGNLEQPIVRLFQFKNEENATSTTVRARSRAGDKRRQECTLGQSSLHDADCIGFAGVDPLAANPRGGRVQALIVIRFSTLATPGARQATCSASSRSAQDRTLPLRVTSPPFVSTVMCLASTSALVRANGQ